MNLETIHQEIEKLSLYEMHRLDAFIGRLTGDPLRQRQVRSLLKVGQNIAYFSREENRDIAAQILDIQRSNVRVKNLHDQKIWLIPFYMLNVDASQVTLGSKQRVDRKTLQVGDKVSYISRTGKECYGVVTKLNSKTAGVRLASGENWRVGYGLLSYFIEGSATTAFDPRLIEGEVIRA